MRVLKKLTPDQDKNSCQQRQHASYDADAKSGESKDSDRDEIDRKQKHADIFGNHVLSIGSYTRGYNAEEISSELFPCAANHDGRNIFRINETIEKFCAGKVRKKHEVIVNLFHFAADLLSRIEA